MYDMHAAAAHLAQANQFALNDAKDELHRLRVALQGMAQQ